MDQHLQRITTAVLDSHDFGQMADNILEAVRHTVPVAATFLTRVESDQAIQRVLFARPQDQPGAAEGTTLPWEHSLCRQALAEEAVFVPDTSTLWPDHEHAHAHGMNSYLCMPIYTRGGELYGTLGGFGHETGREPSPHLETLLSLFAELLAKQIERADDAGATAMSPEAELLTSDVFLLDQLSALCRSAGNLQSVVTDLAELENARRHWAQPIPFYCIGDQAHASWPTQSPLVSHIDTMLATSDGAMPIPEADRSQRQGCVLDSSDVAVQRLRVEAGLAPEGTSALVSAITASGVHGGVVLLGDGTGRIRDGERWLLAHCSDYLSLFAARIEEQQELTEAHYQLERTATQDSPTGLRNRRYLIEELGRILAQADRLGETIHVAFINLDNFKAINDDHGHELGDQLLIEIAHRLHRTTRASDLVARYGGDEFVVVGPGIKPSQAEYERGRLAERLKEATTGQFRLDELVLEYPGPSIGVVSSDEGEMDADRLLARAEEAMYAIKEERRWNAADTTKVIG